MAKYDLNGRASIASAIALGTLSALSFIVQPALVQGYVTQLTVNDTHALDLVGIEMLGVAITATAAAFTSHYLRWRPTTAIALIAAAGGNFASAWLVYSHFFWVARFITGLGEGAIITLGFTFVGLTSRADRNIALYLTALLIYGAVGVWAMPEFLAHFGLPGLFTSFGILSLLGLATVPNVPPAADARVELPDTARDLRGTHQLIALLGKLSYNVAQGIAWAVLFLIGVAAGIGEQPVANALFVSQVFGVFGALSSVFLAGQIARDRAIIVGILGGGTCIAALIGKPGWILFAMCVCGFNFLWNFVLPFILATLGEFDTTGKMIGRSIAMQMIGLGIGPFMAGWFIKGDDYLLVELACVTFFLGSFCLLSVPMNAHKKLIQ